MIEPSKPLENAVTAPRQDPLTRVGRKNVLKDKIATIIEKHPNKSLSVLRRWLHNAPCE